MLIQWISAACRIQRCGGPDRFGEPLEVLLDGRLPRVNPFRRGDEQFERFRGRDLADANRKDRLTLANGPLDLALDELGGVGVLGQHEDEDCTRFDPVDDFRRVVRSGSHIARGDPARDGIFFEVRADRVRDDVVV